MRIERFLRHEIDAGSFPGASFAIGTVAGGIETQGALGHAVAVPLRIPAVESTVYDCASLTKPLITGTLTLRAVAAGKIALDDEYRGYTFRELLTHSSGLRAWLPLYASDDYLAAIEQRGKECARGERAIYSDLNFVLLYHALEEIYGNYVEAARKEILIPLGLADACFNPPAEMRPRIAATEWGQAYEERMCAAAGAVFNGFRRGLIWGETHDGNSFHAGGTCGNAGLFATAEEVFRIVQAFASGAFVPPDLVREATRTHIGDRALAWQTSGQQLSERSWGHTGFTGTSVWVEGDRIMVLLTNRVHPCAAPIAMQKIRGEFHRLATSS